MWLEWSHSFNLEEVGGMKDYAWRHRCGYQLLVSQWTVSGLIWPSAFMSHFHLTQVQMSQWKFSFSCWAKARCFAGQMIWWFDNINPKCFAKHKFLGGRKIKSYYFVGEITCMASNLSIKIIVNY